MGWSFVATLRRYQKGGMAHFPVSLSLIEEAEGDVVVHGGADIAGGKLHVEGTAETARCSFAGCPRRRTKAFFDVVGYGMLQLAVHVPVVFFLCWLFARTIPYVPPVK